MDVLHYRMSHNLIKEFNDSGSSPCNFTEAEFHARSYFSNLRNNFCLYLYTVSLLHINVLERIFFLKFPELQRNCYNIVFDIWNDKNGSRTQNLSTCRRILGHLAKINKTGSILRYSLKNWKSWVGVRFPVCTFNYRSSDLLLLVTCRAAREVVFFTSTKLYLQELVGQLLSNYKNFTQLDQLNQLVWFTLKD